MYFDSEGTPELIQFTCLLLLQISFQLSEAKPNLHQGGALTLELIINYQPRSKQRNPAGPDFFVNYRALGPIKGADGSN